MKVGDRVIAKMPNCPQSDVGEIIEGPIVRNNKTVFKVQYEDFENWVSGEYLKPFLRPVD